jgi:ubiquinone biosynthesis UbiH/UbiF/VisC/COQ6 family hydroxylase
VVVVIKGIETLNMKMMRRFYSLPLLPSRRFSSTISQSGELKSHYDVTIVGGGIVGLTVAKLLHERCPHYSCAVLDSGGMSNLFNHPSTTGSTIQNIPHPRSYALSPQSWKLLGSDIATTVPQGMYTSMQIWEAKSPAMLVFSMDDIDPAIDAKYLGSCVEDFALAKALLEALKQSENVTIHSPANLETFLVPEPHGPVQVSIRSKNPNTSSQDKPLTEEHVSMFTTNLLIAADGSASSIRNRLGIAWNGIDYGRTAMTCTVELDTSKVSHPKRAYQRFLRHGPIALLPTYSDSHGVIVWSTTPDHAAQLKSMNSEQIIQTLNYALQQGPQRLDQLSSSSSSVLYGLERVLDTIHYGLGMRHWSDDNSTFAVPPIVKSIASSRLTFPLSCKLASQLTHSNHRIALVGDAAHTVHPLAGQGLNLGLEDVKELIQAIQKSHDAGMADASMFLAEYEHNRKAELSLKMAGIHGLHTVFEMQSPLAKHGKSMGMSFLNSVKSCRSPLIQMATGLS